MTPSCGGAPDAGEFARFQAVCVAWSWFRQSGVVSYRLVVEPVKTHRRLRTPLGAHFTAKVTQGADGIEHCLMWQIMSDRVRGELDRLLPNGEFLPE